MGLLDNIMGGGQGRGQGGPSAMTMALMALLAYRTYQGKGRLAEMLGRGQQAGGGTVPAGGGGGLGGALGGGAGGGGLGGLLGGILGGGNRGGLAGAGPAAGGGGLGDLLRGGLGGALGGGAAGGFMGAGLNELLNKFQQAGHGTAANSWVGTGPNHEIAPDQIEHALGKDTLQTLSDETGRPYSDVLADLTKGLPQTVDQLTPQGRLPSDEETSRWV